MSNYSGIEWESSLAQLSPNSWRVHDPWSSWSRLIFGQINTLGKDTNPITNSDLYSRTDHFVSASTGHQQSNRGGGSGGAATYWEVRMAKTADQARGKVGEARKSAVCLSGGRDG